MNKNYEIIDSFEKLPSPAYVCEEELLENNLKLLKRVQDETGVKILLALKGFAMYSTFDLCKKYLKGCCASGLHEALLAKEEFGGEVHTYSPAFKDEEIDEIISISNHLVFNSFNQLKRYKDKAFKKVSLGVRLNPEYSSVEVDLYNPCAPNSRLGITKANFDESQLQYLEGFHFHALCEQNVDALEGALAKFEENFSQYFSKLKWINFGGGHHITRPGYDIARLEKCIEAAKKEWKVDIYLEPGEAWALNAGFFLTTVLDVLQNGDTRLAILDGSAACHMPDVLEMPYRPPLLGAGEPGENAVTVRLGGPTCLSGDVIGDYSFQKPLAYGDLLMFGDMAIYTTCKNNTFNGMPLPDIWLRHGDETMERLTDFGYEDFKGRLGRRRRYREYLYETEPFHCRR